MATDKGPIERVDDILRELTEALEDLPYAGKDQLLRAQENIARVRREVKSIELREAT